MAGQERTESATPRRQDEVRRRGQVARSTEINSVAGLLVGFLFLRAWGGTIVGQVEQVMRATLGDLHQDELTVESAMQLGLTYAGFVMLLLAPVFAVMLLVGIVSNVAQVGLLFTMKPLVPDVSRINPLKGFGRLVSTRSLVELVKSLIKIAIVGFVIYRTIIDRIDVIVMLPRAELMPATGEILNLVFDLGIRSAGALLIIAVIDYGYQRYSFSQSIRMTKQEVREEMKQTEGNPQIKQRIRQLQRSIAQRRMMQAVPQADVVITNPTHIAVAIQYQPGSHAPMVVAKGQDFIAERIKQVAREAGVAIIENKPLARALNEQVDIGEEIPAELFQAVAEILAFIYRLRKRSPVGAVSAR